MRKIVLLCLGIMVCSSVTLGAFDFTISSGYHGPQMLEGEESLLMTGGGVIEIRARDFSYVEVQGTTPLQINVGGIYDLNLYDSSSLLVTGGEIGGIDFRNNATAVLQGGSILHISSFQYVPMPNNIAYPHITIDCQLDSVVYDSQTNVVAGNWKNGDPFSIQLHDQSGYDPVMQNIEFVPEPATLLLFGVGGFGVRRFVKRRQLK